MRKLILGLFLAAITLTGLVGCKHGGGGSSCGCGK
jgi:hypothetical protein